MINDNDPGEISEVGTVDATYSFDPITAADSPRGILKNADLIKVSIEDTGRDKRTPVLLPVGARCQHDDQTPMIMRENHGDIQEHCH